MEGCCETWWQKTAARKHLSATSEYILTVTSAWRWESGRRGEGGGGREVAESDTGGDGPWYAGMDTGDAHVGKYSCVET